MTEHKLPNPHWRETLVISLIAVSLGAYAGDSFQSADVLGGIIGLFMIGILLTFIKLSLSLTERRKAIYWATRKVQEAEQGVLLALADHDREKSDATGAALMEAERVLRETVSELKSLVIEQEKLK